jgi:hypothetical protein
MSTPNDFPARGKLLAIKDGSVVFAPTGTNYELQLMAAGPVTVPLNTPTRCIIRVTARRLWTVPSGGNFLSPIFGPPRTIQGRVKFVSEKQIVLQAGTPILVDLPAASVAMDMNCGGITVGSLVNVLALPGASYSEILESVAMAK